MASRQDRRSALALQHERGVGAERLAGGLRQGVEGLGAREGRAEDLSDPVEAALHLGLALTLLEALGVVKGERGEPCKGLDDLEVALVEPTRLACADSEHAACFPQPGDRGTHDVAEDRVGGTRSRLLGGGEVVGQDALAGQQGTPDRPLGRNLAPDVPLGNPDDCAAAEERAIGLENPTVRRLGAREGDHLLHEPSDDGLEAKIAGQHLGGLDQRLLAAQTLLVLGQEAGGVDGEAQLPGNRFGEGDLPRKPARRLPPVQAEDADHLVEDDDRGRQRSPRAEVEESLAVAQAGIRDLVGRLVVLDDDRPALPGGEVELRKSRRGVSDRVEPGRVPLGEHRHGLSELAEPDEGARDADRLGRLLDRDAENGVEVELGAHAPPDLGDEPLALQRHSQGFVRASTPEREGRLAGQALHDVELGGREAPMARPGQRDEDTDDVAFRKQGDERGALRSQGIGQRAIHVRRGDGVVDGQRSTLADDRDDRALVFVEVEHDRLPPVLVDAPRGEADGDPQLLVDAGKEERVGPQQDLDLFEEQGRGLLPRLRPREGGGET